MLKIKDNITLEDLKIMQFEIGNYELLFKINDGCYLAFDFNTKSDDYLKYIGIEMFNTMEQPTDKEINYAIDSLEIRNFIEKVDENE